MADGQGTFGAPAIEVAGVRVESPPIQGSFEHIWSAASAKTTRARGRRGIAALVVSGRLIPTAGLIVGLLAVPSLGYAHRSDDTNAVRDGGHSNHTDGHGDSGVWDSVAARPALSPSPLPGPMAMIEPSAQAFITQVTVLPTTGWIATASDQAAAFPASNVLDGNTATIWHSKFSPTPAPLPHSVTIDMRAIKGIKALTYLPRQDVSSNGTVGRYSISVSADGTSWGTPVATGTWSDNKSLKNVVFAAVNARYIRLTTLTEAGNRGAWSSAAEINLVSGIVAPPPLPRAGWTAVASDYARRIPRATCSTATPLRCGIPGSRGRRCRCRTVLRST